MPASPRRSLDLTLYLVTDTALCGAAGVSSTVAAAVGGGVSAVQLRDPSCSDAEFVLLGRAVADALGGTDVPLVVNDRVHLVGAIGADGAHVGQGDLSITRARTLLGPTALLGLSVQTPDHVAALAALPEGTVDYLGVGPVWPQTTKPDAAPPGGLRALAAIVAATPLPCVAIGGVTPGRIAEVAATGAAGVAVISAICGQSDPTAAAKRMRREWEEATR